MSENKRILCQGDLEVEDEELSSLDLNENLQMMTDKDAGGFCTG